MENFKNTDGNSRDTSYTSSDASLPSGRSDVGGSRSGHARFASRGQIWQSTPPATATPSGRCPHRTGIYVLGKASHAHVIQHRRAFDYCCHVSRIAVWPQRHRDVASRIKLYASRRDGHGAAASGKATSWPSADRKHSWGSSKSVSRSGKYSNGGWHASAGFSDGEELERTSSNCTDGCQTSFKYGNQPWNGCSGSEANFKFSATCRNVRNFKTYQECRENGLFLGARHYEVWWYCSSLLAGGKLSGEKVQVAEVRQPGRR
jgi:hypothetical protein